MGLGGGGGEGQGAYNRINSKESASKQGIKHCWSKYILKVLPGGGGRGAYNRINSKESV